MEEDEPDQGANRFPKKPRYSATEFRQVGLAFAIPGMLLAGPLVGFAFGWIADVYLGAPEWARIVGLLLGLVAGIRESYLAVRKMIREQDSESHE